MLLQTLQKPDFYKPSGGANPASESAATTNPAAPQAPAASVESSVVAKPPLPKAEPPKPAAAAAPPAKPAAAQPAADAAYAAAAHKPVAPAAPAAANATAAAQPSATTSATAAAKAAQIAAAAAKPTTASPAAPAQRAGRVAAPAGGAASKPAVAPTATKPAAATPSAAPAAKPTVQPGAQGAGGGGAGGSGASGGGNGWLLHPSFPVDVRLLGSGVVGAGALYYSLSGGGDAPAAAPKPGVVEEKDFVMLTGAEPADQETVAAAEVLAAEAAEAQPAEPEPASGAAVEQQPGAAAGAAADESTTAAGTEAAAEEEPVYVDGSQVLGLIEEVFSQDTVEQLRALEARAAAEVAAAAAASEHTVDAAGADTAAEAGTAQAAGNAAAAAATAPEAGAQQEQQGQGDAQQARQQRRQAAEQRQQRRVEEEVAVLQAAVADQAGEAVASDFVQSGKKPAEPAHVPPPSPTPLADSDAATRAKQLLGLPGDLSAAALIAQAVALGMGPAQDWSDYQQRHRQAEADAAVLSRLLEAAGAHVEAQLESAHREAEAGRAEAAAARRQLAEQADAFRGVLRDALGRAEEAQRAALRRQAEQLAAAHAEIIVQERVERSQALDGVRERVNALGAAFCRRSDEQRVSHEAHQLSLGAFALLAALAAGQPLGEPLALLRGLAGKDPVVAAAVAAVPAEAATQPVPTRGQLCDRFADVARLTRQLSMLPAGQGGLLSVALAKLAAHLKIAERGPLAASLPGGGVDRRLAAAQQAVVDGQLLAAAAELEAAVAGTAAGPVVAEWAAAVRVRATAEQTAALLEAHAAAETASLA